MVCEIKHGGICGKNPATTLVEMLLKNLYATLKESKIGKAQLPIHLSCTVQATGAPIKQELLLTLPFGKGLFCGGMHLENLVRHGIPGIAFYKLRTHPSPYGPIAEPFSVSALFAKMLNDAAATMPGSLDDVLAFNVAGYKIDDLGEREFSFRLLVDGEIFDKELSVRVPRPVKRSR